MFNLKKYYFEPISKLLKSVTPAKVSAQKEPKILDSATLHCVSSFRRNYNNRLLKLALLIKLLDPIGKNGILRCISGFRFHYTLHVLPLVLSEWPESPARAASRYF
jgi:hypothetical protein